MRAGKMEARPHLRVLAVGAERVQIEQLAVNKLLQHQLYNTGQMSWYSTRDASRWSSFSRTICANIICISQKVFATRTLEPTKAPHSHISQVCAQGQPRYTRYAHAPQAQRRRGRLRCRPRAKTACRVPPAASAPPVCVCVCVCVVFAVLFFSMVACRLKKHIAAFWYYISFSDDLPQCLWPNARMHQTQQYLAAADVLVLHELLGMSALLF